MSTITPTGDVALILGLAVQVDHGVLAVQTTWKGAGAADPLVIALAERDGLTVVTSEKAGGYEPEDPDGVWVAAGLVHQRGRVLPPRRVDVLGSGLNWSPVSIRVQSTPRSEALIRTRGSR